VGEFQSWFATDDDCLGYLEQVQVGFPADEVGYACPGCATATRLDTPPPRMGLRR